MTNEQKLAHLLDLVDNLTDSAEYRVSVDAETVSHDSLVRLRDFAWECRGEPGGH